ncbi:sensor histidine kinase [Amycolatopsis nigrescens]|uniref:sensor histidine kinase n=1 Tax=Amycolatopsis nigrescens TaxID=381445 RepID=UPI0003A8EFED
MPTTEALRAPETPASEQAAPEEAAPPAKPWLSVRHWRLRSKLALVLIIPALTALGLGGLRAINEFSRAQDFHQTVSQVDVAAKVTAVVQELQQERNLTVAMISAGGARITGRSALDDQIADVDRAAAALRAAAGELTTSDQAARNRYQQGLQRLNALAPLRMAASTPTYPDLSAFGTYSSIIDSLVQLGREVNTSVTDRELLRQGTSTQAMSEAKEFLAKESAALQIAAGRHEFPGDLLDQARAAQAGSRASLAGFMANATPAEQRLHSDTVSGPEVDDRERIKQAGFVFADGDKPLTIESGRLTTTSAATLGKYREVENALLSALRGHATELAQSATATAWSYSGGVLVAVLAALVLMLVIARSMLSPLRALRANALDVAYVRLPGMVRSILDNPNPVEAAKKAIDPVPVDTNEEIGEVARSFDVVHEQAVRLAAEQALLRNNVNGMFVNLSRRSQRLVERQLGVIDRLEAEEQDPDQLASLFELDHLATRLRRNGESLLVLAGAGLAKSVPKPVSAADVIGAAVSEVEQYARIEVGAVPDVQVQGLTIHDLVHLLAELLDNATYFSEPETKVGVRAVITRKKALAIQITDSGVGMSEEQYAEANRRLADPPALEVSVTRRMGLYVVSRLAQRHRIEVRLRERQEIESGLVARIVVPADLLVGSPSPDPRSPHQDSWPSLPSLPVVTEPVIAEPREPIRLDDLIAGSSAPAFLSPPAYHAGADQSSGIRLPRRERPPDQSIKDTASTGYPDDPDNAVTRRLPIYQSVLSRWFTELEESGEPDAGGTAAPEPAESTEAADWRSPSDDGWQKARSLLASKQPLTTATGMPKRVPNEFLVPGSVEPGHDSFTPAEPEPPVAVPVSRLPDVTRERMVRFQRGYTSGRHALTDQPGTGE